MAKSSAVSAVEGQELENLLARRGVEQVRRAGPAVAIPGPDDGGGAADRYGVAEVPLPRAVVGEELGNLTWVFRGAYVKQVHGAGVEAVVVVPSCPDDGGDASDRDGVTELLAQRTVVGQQLGDLQACGGVFRAHSLRNA